ncbi:hypothetical protein DAETH_02570 [Deinococcus aetherius]|uniref:Lipoprotein n=1 Tax=Deinococcus aetherius TaxID=200252 RepID=A0ABM8A9A0_9DEIO|nr:hypothetical protein [Deinococcus aetherius]BDP40288.1 hypothetical protein DAETH_02570 [Deinococcus aetherius]
MTNGLTRPWGLCLPALLLLAACSRVAIVEEPERLPAASEAFLGAEVTLSGRLPGFAEARPLPISLTWPQEAVIGEVQVDGSFRATLVQPPARLLGQVESVLWRGWSYSGEQERRASCPVRSLKAEPAGVLGAEVSSLIVPLAEGGATAVLPQTSPVPAPYRRLIPEAPGSVLNLVYVDRDVKVVGEQKCIIVYNPETKHQYNVSANLTLRKGWNSLVRRFATDMIQGVTIYRTTLEAQNTPPPQSWLLVR